MAMAVTVTVSAQVDVARRTTAITYPLDEIVMVLFRGTQQFPRMKGEARIKRTSRNGTEIDLTVSKMPRPFELGAGYATYVLWAISPNGQVDRLGEIKRRGSFEFDSKISVTTPLQTFALIITAEPHFLVSRPSQRIMLENLSPRSLSGKAITTTASIQYFGNSSDYFRDARTPEIAEVDYSRTPSAILQAKQAIALARYAGAERDAPDEVNEAERLYRNAEDSWRAGRDEEQVDIAARRSIEAAVKAESTALVRKEAREKRNEKSRSDAEIRRAEDRIVDAQNQAAELREELARETRARELAERDAANYAEQLKDARQENGRLREELGRLRVEADTAKQRLESIETERQGEAAARAREQRLNDVIAKQAGLMQSLRKFGTVSKSDRGVVLTLPETFWAQTRVASFAPASDAKIAAIGELLASNTDYRILIESHTDDRGEAEALMTLTQQRARLLADRFTAFGVDAGRIEAKGMGASVPIAANTAAANRAKNRRVQIVLTPEIR
jgi:outer membrane protein OmpA-like peptidoglycan-associated protein